MGIELGDMWIRYRADVSDLASKMGQAKSSMSSANDSAQSAGSGIFSAFQNAGSSLINFGSQVMQGLSTLQNLGQGAVSLAENLLAPAASAETMQTAFTTLLGSTKAANDEMQKLDQFASKTPFTTMDIDQASSQLVGFGASANDVVPDLTAIGDALSAVGRGSAANLDSVVNVFGKIQTEGKLSVGTMQELSVNGVNAWSVLEQQTGKTKDQLTKMIQAGLFPAKDAIKDLTTGIEKNPLYTGGMAKQSNTMTGIVSTLKSNWDQMLVSLGSPILKSLEPVMANIGTALTSPGFKSFAGDIGQKIVDTLESIGQFASANVLPVLIKLGPVVQDVGNWFLLSFQHALPLLQQLGTTIGQVFGGLATYLSSDQFAGIMADFETLGNQIGNVVGPDLQQMGTFASQAFTVIGPILTGVVLPAIDTLVFDLGQLVMFFEQNQQAGQLLGDALLGIGVAFAAIQIGTFLATIPALITGFIAWATTAGAAAVATLAATWPLLAIAAIIALVVVGIVLAVQHWGAIVAWLTGVWSAVSGFFVDLWGKVTGTFQKVTGDVTGFVTGLWGNVVGLFQGGVKNVGDTLGGIGNFFKNAGTTAASHAKSGWDNVTGVYQAGNQKIVDGGKWLYDHNYYVKAAVDKINEAFQFVVKEVPILWSNFTGWIVGEWTTLVSTTTARWTAVSNAIQSAFSAAVTFVVEVWIGISLIFSNAWTNYIQKPLTSAWKAVSDFFSNAWKNWIVGPLTSFWQMISNFFSSAWTNYVQKPVGDFWGKFSNNVSKAWSILTGDFHSLWTSISDWFGGLAQDAIGWGAKIIGGIGQGIQSGIAGIGSTISNIGSNAWHAIGGHAAGGNNLPAGWSIVGEKGPELQYTPQGAGILPNDVFQGLMSGRSASSVVLPAQSSGGGGGDSSSGGDIHVHIHLDGQEMASVLVDPLMNKVTKMIRMQGGRMVGI